MFPVWKHRYESLQLVLGTIRLDLCLAYFFCKCKLFIYREKCILDKFEKCQISLTILRAQIPRLELYREIPIIGIRLIHRESR